MALTLIEAAKLSRNPLARGVMLGVATSDELTSQLLMEPTGGESFVYNREKALPSAEWVSPTHTSLTESSMTLDRVTVPMRMIVSDVDVYTFAEEQQSESTPQTAQQLEAKLKAVGRAIGDKAITGAHVTSAVVANAGVSPGAAIDAVVVGPGQDSVRHGPGSIKYTHTGTFWAYRAPGDIAYGPNVACAADGTITLKSDNPNKYITVTLDVSDATADGETLITFASTNNEPDGLAKFCPSSQTISASSANGDALSFEVLDQMIDDLVKVRSRRAFLMNSKLKRKFMALQRALGGTTPENVALPGISGPVLAYRGIPILQNDWITSAESKGSASTLSSAYLVDLSMEGFHVRVGQRGGSFDVNLDPRTARVMGLKVREIGELEGKEAVRSRVSFYGAFALGSDLAVARASQLITA